MTAKERLERLRAAREREAAKHPEVTAQPQQTFGGMVPARPTLDYYDRHAGADR